MINAFGHEVDPNDKNLGEQQRQAREARGVFDEAELKALRKLAEDLHQP